MPKQLAELLQEQQEPFNLEVYLMERGYSKKASAKKTSKNSLMHCSKMLRAVCNKLVSVKQRRGSAKFCGREDVNYMSSTTQMNRNYDQGVEGVNVFSSGGSDTDMEETPTCSSHEGGQILSMEDDSEREKDGNHQKIREAGSKQLSPVSVLIVELPSNEDETGQLESITRNRSSSILASELKKGVNEELQLSAQQISKTRQDETTTSTSNPILCKRITEDSILSASLWELLIHSASIEKVNYSYCLKSKRILHQTKQLLFDCVREAIESHEKRQRIKGRSPTFLGPEELGKLICDRIMTWSKQSGDESSITQLLHLDLLASAEDWIELEPGIGDIAMEIGDVIFEHLIDEIIKDMLDFLSDVSPITQCLL